MIEMAWASEGAEGMEHATLAISVVINFCLLVGFLFFLLRKPLQKTLADRHDSVKNAADEAAHLYAEAARMLEEYEKKLARLDAEIARILSEAKVEGDAERAKILARAQEAAARIRENAKRASEKELIEMKVRLEQEVLAKAAQEAATLLKTKVTRNDHLVFTRELISHLESIHGPRP